MNQLIMVLLPVFAQRKRPIVRCLLYTAVSISEHLWTDYSVTLLFLLLTYAEIIVNSQMTEFMFEWLYIQWFSQTPWFCVYIYIYSFVYIYTLLWIGKNEYIILRGISRTHTEVRSDNLKVTSDDKTGCYPEKVTLHSKRPGVWAGQNLTCAKSLLTNIKRLGGVMVHEFFWVEFRMGDCKLISLFSWVL